MRIRPPKPSKRITATVRLFAFFLVLAMTGAVRFAVGQEAERIDNQDIKNALQQADWQMAAALADSALDDFDSYSAIELAEIHALRALIFFEKAQTTNAQAHLALALQLHPDLILDPVFFPPRMQKMLDELKPNIVTLSQVDVPVRYLLTADRRVSASWRSLLLPGWGQIHKGQKKRGQWFMIAAGALAGATIAAHLLRNSAEDDYRNAGFNNVDSAYRTFNRYHILRNNLALGLGIVWGVSVLDALIANPPVPSEAYMP